MEEPVNVRYVFMMLLAIADPEGVVVGTDVAIARRLNIPTGEFSRCAEELGRPDPHSNSQEMEGRRVVKSEGERGYLIVNYRTYRGLRDENDRREYMREYMRKRRGGKAALAPVNNGKHCKPPLAKAEEEADAEEKEEANAEDIPALPLRAPLTSGSGKVLNEKNTPESPMAIRIANLFHRRLSTGWSKSEIAAFKSLGEILPEDMDAINAYYANERAMPDGWHRKDLSTFLNNFRGELDRANAWIAGGRKKDPHAKNGSKPAVETKPTEPWTFK